MKKLLPLLGLLVCAQASAQTMYVTDQLRLSMYEQKESKGENLGKLGSGTEVILIKKDGLYANIRTSDGTMGWVKATFLTKEKPARAQLNELTESNRSLSTRAETLQKELDQTRADLKVTQQELDAQTLELRRKDIELEEFTGQSSGEAQLGGLLERDLSLKAALIVAGLSLLAGLGLGAWWLDSRIRRRHGGFRVY